MADTLAAAVSHTVEVKHSRFLAQACAATTVEDALSWIVEVAFPDATHNCWAYRIGNDYRFNDAGEPAGTAGRPILSAIDGQGYDQVVVVVSRWFGGIKLGAGGLMRAYGGTAAECLRQAPRRPLLEMTTLFLECPFDHIGTLHAALAQFSVEKTDECFHADGVRLCLRIAADHAALLSAHLRDASRDRIRFLSDSVK